MSQPAAKQQQRSERHARPGLFEEAHSRKQLQGLLSAALAEFFCMALFLFVVTTTVSSGCHTKDTAAQSGAADQALTKVVPGACFLGSTNLLNIALSFGMCTFVLVYASASFSGGHLNSAITLAMLLARRISLLRAIVYLVCQLAGAMVGSALNRAVDPTGFSAALGATNRRNKWVTRGNAVGVEIILTALLVFVVFAAVDQRRAKGSGHLPVLSPLAIGMALFLCILVGNPIDGCSVNPARSFGPAVVANVWEDHWIFWVGPFIGAALAGLAYEHLAFRTGSLSGPSVDGSSHDEFGV